MFAGYLPGTLTGGITSGVILTLLYLLAHGDREIRLKEIFIIFLFTLYLSAVLHRTIFIRRFNKRLGVRLDVLLTLSTVRGVTNAALNILMMMPWGALVPVLWRRCRKWYVVFLSGLGASLIIESLQLYLNCGQWDLTDLICNSLGALLGYLCLLAYRNYRGKMKKVKK